METRLWNELAQIKYNQFYCVHLLARQKRVLNRFNILTLVFSGAGIMGWKFWETVPFVSCAIISFMQLAKLLQTHIIPTENEIQKLDKASDFYTDFYNKIELLWYSREEIPENELRQKYYDVKGTEKEANKILREILKRVNKKIHKVASSETTIYLDANFNNKIYEQKTIHSPEIESGQ